MPKPHTTWKVLPHDEVTAFGDDILTVTGDIGMPLGTIKRRMTVVRLEGQRLVIFSAIALDDEGMKRIEAFGQPAFLIVPNGMHRIDAKPWKDRYPAMQVIAPAGGRKDVEQILPVDATAVDFGDPGVSLVTVAGTGDQELALIVRRAEGTTLVLNDLVGNIRDATGFFGWFMRMMRFAGDGPQIPRPILWKLIKDKAAAARQLRQWAELPSLSRILVSHGEPIVTDPAGRLRQLAATLS